MTPHVFENLENLLSARSHGVRRAEPSRATPSCATAFMKRRNEFLKDRSYERGIVEAMGQKQWLGSGTAVIQDPELLHARRAGRRHES